MSVTPPLHGIIPPLITPLLAPDQLDAAGLERLVEHVISGGVQGIFILGTTGEGPSHAYSLRHELISRTCRLAARRVPVLVGITDTSMAQSLAVAHHAAQAGADYLVLAPPYYLPPAQWELVHYVEALIGQLPLPLVLYNMPGLTKVSFEVPSVKRLMEHQQIIGLKDTSRDLDHFRQLCELLPQRPGWSLLIGPEEMLADALSLGAHGGVCGGANVFPRLYVSLCKAYEAGDRETLAHLHQRILLIRQRIYQISREPAGVIKSIKCMLRCVGICSDVMAPPFEPFGEEDRARIFAAMADLQG